MIFETEVKLKIILYLVHKQVLCRGRDIQFSYVALVLVKYHVRTYIKYILTPVSFARLLRYLHFINSRQQ